MKASKRLKTCRAIEANAGIRNLYAKKLGRLSKAWTRFVFQEIVLHLHRQHFVAMDASLSRPRSQRDKERLRKLQLRLSQMMREEPEKVQEDVDAFVSEKLSGWTDQLTTQTQKICEWFVKTTAKDVTASLRRVLTSAGFPPDYMAEKWSIPIVRGQYVSKTAAKMLPLHVEWATSLITKMHIKDVQRLQEVILRGVLEGQSFRQVRDTLSQFEGFDMKRAERVARDQINKINQAIQRDNQLELGITQGIWVHVPGQFTSRETHVHMNNKLFDLKEGLYDEDVNKYVVPGELPYCRCVYKAVLPSSVLETKK